MTQADQATKVPTMDDLDEALRKAAASAIKEGVHSEKVLNTVEALSRLRRVVRDDADAACRVEESRARTASHRQAVAAADRIGPRNRGKQ